MITIVHAINLCVLTGKVKYGKRHYPFDPIRYEKNVTKLYKWIVLFYFLLVTDSNVRVAQILSLVVRSVVC